jgi:hypothetical protein
MERREFLGAASAFGAAGVAGCAGLFEDDGEDGADEGSFEPALVEDRPDAVYYPTHAEGMEMAGMGSAGDLNVGLMYSFPHRFWIVNGTNAERVDVREEDAVHLMATLWDPETEMVLSVGGGLTMTVEKDGEILSEKPPWPMLSQNMGFHYGDNYALDGDGTYTVTVDPGSIGVNRFGAFADRFEHLGTAEIEFEYSEATRDSIPYRTLDDQAGERGAVDLMAMRNVPVSVAPAREELPGRIVGEGESGDADILVTAIDDPSFVPADSYLAVSPRTPHNRVPLPMMALQARVERDDEEVYDANLRTAIHPDLGHHYWEPVDVQSGDEITIDVRAGSQASRHEGYETAFRSTADVEFTVE